MCRVQQIVSKTSAKIGQSVLNILNIDAQEETSRIIVVVEDSGNNIKKQLVQFMKNAPISNLSKNKVYLLIFNFLVIGGLLHLN